MWLTDAHNGKPSRVSASGGIIGAVAVWISISSDIALKLAPAAVALLAIAVTLYIRWSGRRVRVRIEIREAWSPRAWPLVAVGGHVIEPPDEPYIFDGSIVLLNLGERPIFVERLGIELVNEPIYGYDDAQTVAREVKPHGGSTSLKLSEDAIGFDIRGGFRGYADVAGERKPRWTKVFVPGEPPSDVRWEDPPSRAP